MPRAFCAFAAMSEARLCLTLRSLRLGGKLSSEAYFSTGSGIEL